MSDRDFLDEIFLPGQGIVRRTTNKLRRGYLKRSFLNCRDSQSKYEPHQGKKEIERRRRRMERMNHA